MTTQSILKENSKDKYFKPMIRALVCQVKMDVHKFHDDQNLCKHENLTNSIRMIIATWLGVEPVFDGDLPDLFIESAIYAHVGEAIKPTFQDLGLKVDLKLSREIKKWLYG